MACAPSEDSSRVSQRASAKALALSTPAKSTSSAWVTAARTRVPASIDVLVQEQLLANEQVVNVATRRVNSSGSVYHRLEIFNLKTNDSRKITVSEDGAFVDFQMVLSSERIGHMNHFGKLSEALYNRLATATEPIRLRIVYRFSPLPPKPIVLDDAALAIYTRQMKKSFAVGRKELLSILKANKATVHSVYDYSPIIEVSLEAEKVIPLLAKRDGVRYVSEKVPETRILHAAHTTTQTNTWSTFYAASPQCFGSGVKVGISGEGNSSKCGLWETNPWLTETVVNQMPPKSCASDSDCTVCISASNPSFCVDNKCTVYHGTAVAGMIGHVYGFLARMAPLVTLYHANDTTGDTSWLNWFRQEGVYIVNESWGGAEDQYTSDLHAISGTHILKASGNAPNMPGGFRTDCYASNIICVGGYRFDGTTYFATKSNGLHWAIRNFTNCSQFTTGCDRELPHVAFVAQGAVSTHNNINDADYLVTWSGTSAAAPAASGLVALMLDRWPSYFLGWPELTRAALMTSAIQNVEGASISTHYAPDEADGAGIPDAARIEAMINGNRLQQMALYKQTSLSAALFSRRS